MVMHDEPHTISEAMQSGDAKNVEDIRSNYK